MSDSVRISPGRLVKLTESVTIRTETPGQLVVYRLSGMQRVALQTLWLEPGRESCWTAPNAGGYLLVFEPQAGGPTWQRYIGVVQPQWAVCQITIGAFTSESFAELVHDAGVPVDYYVGLPAAAAAGPEPYAADDPRWPEYEQRYGDAIHPHFMAADLGGLDATLAHHDANWSTLSTDQIEYRLRWLQAWWRRLGYEPLDRIATYTPCNEFIQACRRVGIRILHSLVPEQNWSDGEWGINDWGMPNCPFWIASDDYRKPASWTEDAVLGISMDHYGVLPPHLTRWGDYALSPSHYLRWNRATDSGPAPVRFEQFLRDTLEGWRSLSAEPFFFAAGFEFGRTFGTTKMTDYNRLGLERLIELSASQRVVFATSRDVRAYYDRHQRCHPESLFLQRDYWAGTTVNGKPAMAGDSLVIERAAYKALVREGESLPLFHYDYRIGWKFPTAAEDAPEDFAEQDRSELQVSRSGDAIVLRADKPLGRAVPVVAWDAIAADDECGVRSTPVLDDGRRHTLIELPAGWSGRRTIRLNDRRPVAAAPPTWWKAQSFGEGERQHTYLHLDLPLVRKLTIPIELKRPACVDVVQGPLGRQAAGRFELHVGPSSTWHRFWGVGPQDLSWTTETEAAVAALRPGEQLLAQNWCEQVHQHTKQLHEAMLLRTGVRRDQIALEVFCGANLPLGGRCRAAPFDIVHTRVEGLGACECGDGVIAYGPGESFWYHPRGFPLRVIGLAKLRHARRIRLLLHTFDTAGEARLQVTSAGHFSAGWRVPRSAWDEQAWLMLTLDRDKAVADDRLTLRLQTDQKQLLYDWWAEGGFIAALHALWVLVD